MTTVLQVELLVEGNDGEHFYLVSDELEAVSLSPVVGEFIHTSRTKLEVVLKEGAEFRAEPVGDEEED